MFKCYPHRWSPHTWWERIKHSSFLTLIQGGEIESSEIDEVINTLALVFHMDYCISNVSGLTRALSLSFCNYTHIG